MLFVFGRAPRDLTDPGTIRRESGGGGGGGRETDGTETDGTETGGRISLREGGGGSGGGERWAIVTGRLFAQLSEG